MEDEPPAKRSKSDLVAYNWAYVDDEGKTVRDSAYVFLDPENYKDHAEIMGPTDSVCHFRMVRRSISKGVVWMKKKYSFMHMLTHVTSACLRAD